MRHGHTWHATCGFGTTLGPRKHRSMQGRGSAHTAGTAGAGRSRCTGIGGTGGRCCAFLMSWRTPSSASSGLGLAGCTGGAVHARRTGKPGLLLSAWGFQNAHRSPGPPRGHDMPSMPRLPGGMQAWLVVRAAKRPLAGLLTSFLSASVASAAVMAPLRLRSAAASGGCTCAWQPEREPSERAGWIQ